MSDTMVLGIGNILLSDEGLGVRLMEELKKRKRLPPQVDLLDGGTLGFALLSHLEGVKRLIVLDAVRGGKEAGACYEFSGSEVDAYFQAKLSLHQLGIKEVFAALEVMDKAIDEIIILGIEPLTLEVGLELSEPVRKSLPRIVARVEELLMVKSSRLETEKSE